MGHQQLSEHDYPLRVDGLKIFSRRGRRILTAVDVQTAQAVVDTLNRTGDLVIIPRLTLGNPKV